MIFLPIGKPYRTGLLGIPVGVRLFGHEFFCQLSGNENFWFFSTLQGGVHSFAIQRLKMQSEPNQEDHRNHSNGAEHVPFRRKVAGVNEVDHKLTSPNLSALPSPPLSPPRPPRASPPQPPSPSIGSYDTFRCRPGAHTGRMMDVRHVRARGLHRSSLRGFCAARARGARANARAEKVHSQRRNVTPH